MNKNKCCINISEIEVPYKLIFHSLMLIVPLFFSIWLYLLQVLFLSPFVIVDTINLYKIYRGGSTCHVYRNKLDFIFEVGIPIYRHNAIMYLGGYRKWHGLD